MYIYILKSDNLTRIPQVLWRLCQLSVYFFIVNNTSCIIILFLSSRTNLNSTRWSCEDIVYNVKTVLPP